PADCPRNPADWIVTEL
ncbi:hypothetical protein CFOL_v3_15244, partial [Cephalotus follicularis]